MKRFIGVLTVLLGTCVFGTAAEDHVVTNGTQATPLTGAYNLVKNAVDSETPGTYVISQRNTYTGTTTINAGTVEVTYAPGDNAFSTLSNTAVTINAEGILKVNAVNALGKVGAGGTIGGMNTLITVNGGTIHNNLTNNHANLAHLVLNGGKITSAGGGSPEYGSFLLAGSVNVTGNAAINLTKFSIRSTTVGIKDSVGKWTVAEGKTLTVAPANGTDLTTIRMNDWDNSIAVLEKLGAGTLNIQGKFVGGGTLKISEGTVNLIGANGSSPLGTTTVEMNGSTLKLLNSSTSMGEFNGTVTGTGTIVDATGIYGHHVSADLSGFTGVFDAKNTMVFKNTTKGMAGVELWANGGDMCFTDDCKSEVGMIAGSGVIRPSTAVPADYLTTVVVGNDTAYDNHTFSGRIIDQSNGTGELWNLAIEKVGSNTWTLSSGASTYTGGTTISGGVLEITNGNALGTGKVTLNGGTLKWSETLKNAIDVVKDSTLQSVGGASLTGTLSGTGNLAVLVNTYARFEGSMANYQGTITSTGDWIFFQGDATDAVNTSVVVNGAGLALIDDKNSTFQFASLSGGGELRASISAKANSTITLQVGGGNYAGKILDYSDGRILALEKVGTGKWTLSGENAYSGGTKVSEGVLEITNGNALGTGKVTLNGGTLQLSNRLEKNIGIVMAADSTIDLNADADFWFNGSLTGSKDLRITSSNNKRGVFHIGGDSSSYTGTVTMAATTNETFFTLESGARNFSNAVIDLGDKTRFFYNAANVNDVFQVGMLSGTSGSLVQAYTSSANGTSKLQVGNDTEYTNHTFGGVLQNRSGAKILAVEKVGTNTWTLSGTNTYTGATTVSEGVLELTSTGKITQSTVTVEGGTLKNAGTISQAITVKEGGTYLSAGGTTHGLTLEKGAILAGDFLGTVTFTDGSILDFDLDELQSMDLTDATFGGDIVVALDALDAETLRDQTFNLFTTNKADILDILLLDTTNAPGNVAWITSYANGTVSLLAGDPSKVPEPASWFLLLGMLAWFIRKRTFLRV